MESDMKRLMISALVFVALLTIGTGLLRSHSFLINSQVETTSMATSISQGQQRAIGTDKLPVQDFEDRSLVFPREMKP
jgi:hypothetical protein